MSFISKLIIGTGGDASSYDLKDKNAQTKTLTTPITVDGTEYSTVETALSAINNKSSGTDAYVDGTTLYLPTEKASVSADGKLIIT